MIPGAMMGRGPHHPPWHESSWADKVQVAEKSKGPPTLHRSNSDPTSPHRRPGSSRRKHPQRGPPFQTHHHHHHYHPAADWMSWGVFMGGSGRHYPGSPAHQGNYYHPGYGSPRGAAPSDPGAFWTAAPQSPAAASPSHVYGASGRGYGSALAQNLASPRMDGQNYAAWWGQSPSVKPQTSTIVPPSLSDMGDDSADVPNFMNKAEARGMRGRDIGDDTEIMEGPKQQKQAPQMMSPWAMSAGTPPMSPRMWGVANMGNELFHPGAVPAGLNSDADKAGTPGPSTVPLPWQHASSMNPQVP